MFEYSQYFLTISEFSAMSSDDEIGVNHLIQRIAYIRVLLTCEEQEWYWTLHDWKYQVYVAKQVCQDRNLYLKDGCMDVKLHRDQVTCMRFMTFGLRHCHVTAIYCCIGVMFFTMGQH